MSFILDALKKSENERQKQGGPALFEVKVAPPPRRFPAWAVVVGLLLGVNLVVLIAVLLMRDRQAPAVQPTQTAIDANVAPSTAPSAMPGAAGPPPGAMPAPMPTAPAPAPRGAALGPDGLPVATGTVTPADGLRGAPTRFNPPLVEEDPAEAYEPPPAPRGAPVNPADYMPATAGPAPVATPMPQPSGYPLTAGSGPSAPPGRASSVRTSSAIPSRDDLMASGQGDIPPASVGLHVYDASPGARFVFVNGTRAKEGDVLPNGLRVDEITAEGTVLSFRGSRFLVPIQ
jgi:general secretion pathway protein B